MSRTERWVSANVDFILSDSTWIHFQQGQYDSRDMMSDVVRPQWNRSGEYRICIIPSDKTNNSDADFVAYVDTDWANKIYYNLKNDRYNGIESLKDAFRYEGKKMGTYETCNNMIKEMVRLGL